MKIYPDPPDLRRPLEPATTPSKTEQAFGEALTSKTEAKLVPPATQSASSSIGRQDSTDPSQANATINRAVQEMMEKEFRGMCAPDRERVAEWLRNDPIVRDALLKRPTS